MTGRIPDDVIAEIRDRVDLVAVIGEHVALKKAGTSFKGLCPFHGEKTPSFHVTPHKHSWYCFGCQERGDAFAFLMKMHGKTFAEAVRELAARTGVTIPEKPESEHDRARRTEKERMFDVNAIATSFYREQLAGANGAAGRRYLESRGIGDAIRETFQLGLAPDAWDALALRLAERKIPPQLSVPLGLVAPRQNKPGFYDKFRNRLMCPVILPGGEIAGFSGRTLGSDPETPKYVNSPESPVYKKSHLVFGLHAARAAFRARNRALLVEGNFDVIALHQAGFSEAVAPLGTALTEQQITVIRRLAPTITVLFDGDKAGRAASMKAVPMLVAAGVEGRIASLPDGEDPDSFVRKHGAPALEELLQRATPSVEYFLDQIWFRTGRSAEERASALREAAPFLASIGDDVKRDVIVDQFARALDVPPNVVRKAMQQGAPPPAMTRAPEAPPKPVVRMPPPPALELQLLRILNDHPDLVPIAEQKNARSLLTHAALRDMYSAAVLGEPMMDAVPAGLSDVIAKLLNAPPLQDPQLALEGTIARLAAARREDQIRQQIDEATRRGDQAAVRVLIQEQSELKKAKA